MGDAMIYKLIKADYKIFVKRIKNPNPINKFITRCIKLKTIKEI